MVHRLKLIVLFALLNSLSGLAPLQIPLRVTASFMEYRGARFHAGLDFSTQHQNGHEVFAVQTGYVYRVKRTRYGEGNTIYLKHQDGSISVYAHLDEFVEAINRLLPAEEGETYPKDRVWFQAGDRIAYSGESGSGLPHLHFELRSAENHPGPIDLTQLGLSDTNPPTLKTLRVVPYLTSGLVQEFRVDKERLLHVNAPVPVAIELEVLDTMDGHPGRMGIARLELVQRLKEGNRIRYAAEFDHIHFTSRVNTSHHFNRSLTGFSPTRYTYKLYVDSVWKSAYVKTHLHQGAFGKGEYDLSLMVEDMAGNRSTYDFTLHVDAGQVSQPRPYVGPAEFNVQDVYLRLNGAGLSHFVTPTLQIQDLDGALSGVVKVVELGPGFLWPSQAMTLGFKTPCQGHYLARFNSSQGRWHTLRSQTQAGHCQANIDEMGTYAMLVDRQSPRIESKKLVVKGIRRTREYVKVIDLQSGVDDKSLALSCQKKTVNAFWDSDRSAVELPEGCQQLELRVCDRAENCADARLTFQP